MRTFILDVSRKAGLNAKGHTYKDTMLLNYKWTKEDGVQILDSMGGWRKSILRIDALLNMQGIQETTKWLDLIFGKE